MRVISTSIEKRWLFILPRNSSSGARCGWKWHGGKPFPKGILRDRPCGAQGFTVRESLISVEAGLFHKKTYSLFTQTRLYNVSSTSLHKAGPAIAKHPCGQGLRMRGALEYGVGVELRVFHPLTKRGNCCLINRTYILYKFYDPGYFRSR